ncbi:MAG: hypothetical protein MJ247_06360 [Alphaproteobacteria bacterium]|nr:hypothetical protein [Alphaproteobacteria bacterium]
MNMELENDSTDDLELKFENEFLRQLVFDSNKQNEYIVDEIRYTCLSYLPVSNWAYSYKRTEDGIKYVYEAGASGCLEFFPSDAYVKFIIEKNKIFSGRFSIVETQE